MKCLRFVPVVLLTAAIIATVPMSRVHATGRNADHPAGQTTQPPAVVTLKVTVVISRFENDKKTGSLPFVFMVVPGPIVQAKDGPMGAEGDVTSLQMGAEVPVAVGLTTPGNPAAASYQYRSIGTNINAAAKWVDEGRYSLFLNVTDSQVMSEVPKPGSGARIDPTPLFQSFKSSNRLILRDGQTVQYTAATDKTSGEVVKLDVTLNVIK